MIQRIRVYFLFSLVVLAGCLRSPTPYFYSLVSQERVAGALPISKDGTEVEVSSIVFPHYLEDPRMVIRSGGHEVVRDEYRRWIEDLDVNFRRALLNDLSRHLKSGNVFSSEDYPQRRGARVVQIEVLQFDISEDGSAVLKARWAVAPTRDDLSSVTMTNSEFQAQAEGSSTEARVTTLSELIDTFAREVAQKVVG